MKQLLQDLRSGKTLIADVPVPTPDPGQVLVRTAVSLVSAGTERMLVEFAEKSLLGKARARPDLVRQALDKARREGLLTALEGVFNRLGQPLELGYSSAGTVVRLGERVMGLRAGQRVACAGGGYAVHAEYAAVPYNLVTPLPDVVDFESAAFTTLGAVALHGFRLAETQLGEYVAVIGLGLLGLLAAGIARAAGCQVMGVDLDPERVRLAGGMGIAAVGREGAEEATLAFSHGRGCDAVLICADSPSADPVELAGAIARDRGRVVAVGAVDLHLPRKVYYAKELSFVNSRSYGPGRYDPAYEEGGTDYPIGYVRWTEGRNLEAFVELLANGSLDVRPLITHRFPIERAGEAYALITGKPQDHGGPFLGVLLTYPEAAEGEAAEAVERIAAPVTGLSEPSTGVKEAAKADRVTLGALGAGNFAMAMTFPALRGMAGVELVGVVSASGQSAQHAARRFGFSYAASDPDRLLQDEQVNTIAILTRHHLHARQALRALRAGKHTFCEKPLALAWEEVDEIERALEEIAEAARLDPDFRAPLLTVGFNRRFAPLALEMKSFLDGRREPLYCHYRVNAGPLPATHWTQDPAQGGGRILGEACHFVDFLTFLTGHPPAAVTAHGLPEQAGHPSDNVELAFEFPDGSLGSVSYLANGDRAFSKERAEAFCGGRVAVLDDFRQLELVAGGRRRVSRSRLRQDKGHRDEWKAFTAAILSGGPPPIPYAHLLGVSRATLAAVEALKESRRVIIE